MKEKKYGESNIHMRINRIANLKNTSGVATCFVSCQTLWESFIKSTNNHFRADWTGLPLFCNNKCYVIGGFCPPLRSIFACDLNLFFQYWSTVEFRFKLSVIRIPTSVRSLDYRRYSETPHWPLEGLWDSFDVAWSRPGSINQKKGIQINNIHELLADRKILLDTQSTKTALNIYVISNPLYCGESRKMKIKKQVSK